MTKQTVSGMAKTAVASGSTTSASVKVEVTTPRLGADVCMKTR